MVLLLSRQTELEQDIHLVRVPRKSIVLNKYETSKSLYFRVAEIC